MNSVENTTSLFRFVFALLVPSRCIGLPAYGVALDRKSLDECLMKQDQFWFSTIMIRDLVHRRFLF